MANGGEAIAEFRRHRPDITLRDLRLPGANSTDILIAIRGEFPDARIIMLSSSNSDGEIQRALRSGASGYVLKSMPQDQLLAVIRSVHGGKRHVPAEVAALLAEHLGEEDLTPRELEVLQLIRDGSKNKQIAKMLRLVVGNPLIMKEMAKTVPDAASYAPVTILIDERADGVHLSYDSMASLIAPYGSDAALVVARDLDAKILLKRAVQ